MREINQVNWEGYMFQDEEAWWRFDWTDNAGEKWWSMAGADGVERVAIPAEHWGLHDSNLIGQLIMMFARRRLAYNKMGICVDPLIDQRQEPLEYWEEVVNGNT